MNRQITRILTRSYYNIKPNLIIKISTNNYISKSSKNQQEMIEDLKRAQVDSYWKDIEEILHEPGQISFRDLASGPKASDPNFIYKLISSSLAFQRSQGDLLISLYTKNCCQLYSKLDDEGKYQFLKLLAREFGIDKKKVDRAVDEYNKASKCSNQEPKEINKALEELRQSTIPLYDLFFERVNQLPNGMRFLIDLREDTRNFAKLHKDSELYTFDDSLRLKLQNWLLQFLDLERITWKSSAMTLEKLMKYEKVHNFQGWDDLKQRVGPGRRCYGFFHRSMPLDPLVYIQVALVKDISSNVQSIIFDKSPSHPTLDTVRTAIFYSINSQSGLAGVDLGSFLIKRVVGELRAEFPMIKTFCTLSPLPKFRTWVLSNLKEDPSNFLTNEEKNTLIKYDPTSSNSSEILLEVIKDSRWVRYPKKVDLLKPILMRLALRYILEEKRGIGALGQVANFHLRNGACVHRVNWLGNTSDKGLTESFGIMVNYNYLLEHIEENNQIYLKYGRIPISASPDDPLFKKYFEHPKYQYIFRGIESKL